MSIYLKSADIQGSVTTKGFENTFEVLSATFGQQRSVGSRVGKVGTVDSSLSAVSEVVITKIYDVASTKLFELSFSGKILGNMVISFVRQDQTGPITYSEITLTDVVISNYQFAGLGGAGTDAPTETINLNWGTFSIKNTPAAKDGTAGTPSTTGWNLGTNSKI
ncbi:MAG: hypothetical protein B7Z75_02080 [Acidocella sp. 20-57-95]|nr:MAG: hypothetical protein B7Z75_02080 [Acidocella sp. 20-57-95]OYV62523.1 MAG: hypothetical protein B7Z71_00915 [Acidocella sp. 21-58-7]HQT63791.1 type VI secretion system tube protein Hcp [Acidocella sp.]HQU03195.1 type VI secretion system tube protein Hcp [Acidocella sp.]